MNHSTNYSTKKLRFVFVVISFMFFILIAFLFRWQYFEHDKYTAIANSRTMESRVIGMRGAIYANDGTPLAYSERVFDLYLSKTEINKYHENKVQDKYELFKDIEQSLELKPGTLEEAILSNKSIYFKAISGIKEKDKNNLVEELSNKYLLFGIYFEAGENRIYPNGKLASHIIGFVGKNDQGKDIGRTGLEEYWNGDLVPKEGFITKELDNNGDVMVTSSFSGVNHKNGRDIHTTIDLRIQRILEQKMQEGVEKYKAKSGSAIVMDPKTGSILAMTSVPDYDPARYFEVKDVSDINNRAISNVYENGSVWKVFTASAAIDTGLYDINTIVFDSHPGCITVMKTERICTAFRNSINTPMTLQGVIEKSDNIGSYYISQELGSEKLYDYLNRFGIGAYTNVGLANEQTDLVSTSDKWSELDLGVISFGQSEASTLLQTVSGFSAIANHGVRMQPNIVKEVNDISSFLSFDPKIASTVTTRVTAEKMVYVLSETFKKQHGEMYWSDMTKYQIAGKTGTAEIPKTEGLGYKEDATNATFIGFDASSGRSFVMGIMLEEPEDKAFAYQSALPLWVDIFKDIRSYLKIPTE